MNIPVTRLCPPSIRGRLETLVLSGIWTRSWGCEPIRALYYVRADQSEASLRVTWPSSTYKRPALPGDLPAPGTGAAPGQTSATSLALARLPTRLYRGGEVTIMRSKMINLDNLNSHKLECGSILAGAIFRLLGPSLVSSAVRDSKLIHGIIDHIFRLECVSWE